MGVGSTCESVAGMARELVVTSARAWDSPGFFSIHSLISAALFYDREPYFDEILPRNMKSEKYPQTLSL